MPTRGRETSFQPATPRPIQKIRSRGPALIQDFEKSPRAKEHQFPDPKILSKAGRSQKEFQLIFGEAVRNARIEARLKQSQMASMVGLTQQYLSLIESGRQNVTIRTMALLTRVVDYDLISLLKKILCPPPPE